MSTEAATPLRYAYALNARVVLFLKWVYVGIWFLAIGLQDDASGVMSYSLLPECMRPQKYSHQTLPG